MPSILLDFRDPNLLLPPGDLLLFDSHGDAIPDRKLVNLKRSKELLVFGEVVVWLSGPKVSALGKERMRRGQSLKAAEKKDERSGWFGSLRGSSCAT